MPAREAVVARPEQLTVHQLETGHRWRHALLRCVDEGRKRVIVQILADSRQIDQDLHAEATKLVCRSDA